jgi:exonuclease SbcC
VRITRLALRNYRVYEQPLELEVPAGLVGIYGPNGAGKSYLIESILWTLFGRSRTTKEEVRTSGVLDDCVTEVEFEHEGHLYLVRRTVSGINATVRAEAHADRQQVAEGVRDTRRYVQSILGMDDTAFRASVFAEQKQLAAFSSQTPAERRGLVLQLLGITPLDAARDQARKDARSAREQHERLRALLPDLDQLRARVEQVAAAAEALEHDARSEETALTTARGRLAEQEADHERLEDLRREHDALVAEGRAVRDERDRAAAQVGRLTAELDGLEESAARLAALLPDADGLAEAEQLLRRVEVVETGRRALLAAPMPVEPPAPDEEGCQAVQTAAAEARAALAAVEGQLAGAREESERRAEAVERATDLTGEADCPLCGQALGHAFEQVRAHRAAELGGAEEHVARLEASRAALAERARVAAAEAAGRAARLRAAQEAWADYRRAADRRNHAEAAFTSALATLGREPEPGEVERLARELERRRAAAAECQRLEGRLLRRAAVEAELADERARVADAEGRLENLRDKLRSLGYRPERLAAARTARDEARRRAEQAAEAAHRARVQAERARAAVESETARLADAEAQHARLATLAEDARHLGRLAELLNAFRTTMVATVGPRLAAQAAELFAELTDHEYDRLEVDHDTYEIQIRDAGRLYGMDRFSGSETDLANLALRVAISEHVRFQSGGAVGLLVLDEVFGPLDDDRKERMLLALERLRARFRQVLVVTHASEIKEQLPAAIEVVKLPGRRATARVVTG